MMKKNGMDDSLPDGPEISNVFQASQWFFSSEVASGALLLIFSICAVIWANSAFSHSYHDLLHMDVSIFAGHYQITKSLAHWINDGLMTLFFFTVGLEIKREIMVGELSEPKMALLPIIAAAGGMLVPGLIYACFNYNTPYIKGWGVPVATDIAFSIGALSIFGRKLPIGLRIFLTAFAIADDLGGVIIIAIFYTQSLSIPYLMISQGILLALLLANLFWVRWIPLYVFLGFGLWVAIMGSGVHPTVAGVLTAFFIPVRGKYSMSRFAKKTKNIINNFQYNEATSDYWFSILMNQKHLNVVHSLKMACDDVETPLQRLEHALHPWVAYSILPIFALTNAGLTLQGMPMGEAVTHPVTLGIMLGLLIGKPIGITLFSYISTRIGIASLPENVRWTHIAGAGMLGGIGFTISLFISGLSFVSPELLNYSKLGVLSGSILSAILGITYLSVICAREKKMAGTASQEQ
jgi:NhaA family Na+:H+ antiporter